LGSEHHVFRAAFVSIVLALAIGQNANLLCKVWCAGSAECFHHDSSSSPIVSADDTCRSAVLEAVACVREDVRRIAAASDQNAIVVRRFRLVSSLTGLRAGWESGRRLPLDERPLGLGLRI
jgi:hypothetical protein